MARGVPGTAGRMGQCGGRPHHIDHPRCCGPAVTHGKGSWFVGVPQGQSFHVFCTNLSLLSTVQCFHPLWGADFLAFPWEYSCLCFM